VIKDDHFFFLFNALSKVIPVRKFELNRIELIRTYFISTSPVADQTQREFDNKVSGMDPSCPFAQFSIPAAAFDKELRGTSLIASASM